MANEVEIKVHVEDKTKPGFDGVKRNAEGLKGALKDVGKTAGGILTADLMRSAGQAFGRFVGDSIRQASDLGESINAVNVTFGESAKEVTDWGRKNAASFGLSTAAFNQMATPLGAMLKNAGLSMQDTSKWTIDLTKRASDMASVFNTDVGDALEAIQAGLRGESDPLERFGVGLSAAKVEAKALAETGKTSAKALTDQEKATARLNIIMEQTSQTAGDFANTSDGYANATRIATAQIDNAKAALGESLLPVLGKAAQAAGSLAGAFAGLPGPVQTTIVVVGTLGAAATLLIPKIAAAKRGLEEMGISSLKASGRLGRMAKGAGVAAAALAAANVAGELFGKSAAVAINTATDAMEKFASASDGVTLVTDTLKGDFENLASVGRQGFWNDLEGSLERLTNLGGLPGDTITKSQQRFESWDAALAGMVAEGNMDKAADAFKRFEEEGKAGGYSLEKITALFPQYQDALVGAARDTKKAASATDEAASATSKLNKELAEQEKRTRENSDNLSNLRGAMRDLEASYDDATAALKENGKTLDIGTDKGRANQDTLDGIRDAAVAASEAIKKKSGSQENANKVMETARRRYIATAHAMGMDTAEAKRLADALFAIPKNVNVTVKAHFNTKQFEAEVARLTRNRTMSVAVAANIYERRQAMLAHGGIVGHAAGGGPRGGTVLVGEQGPELVDLPAGARVHSNPDTERALNQGGGGGSDRPIQIVLRIGDRDLGEVILDPLRQTVRGRGGLTAAFGT